MTHNEARVNVAMAPTIQKCAVEGNKMNIEEPVNNSQL
ncbi:hypothetical protein RU98_GL003031 [Enterococcus caccae]|nr:hypothetical protein RU98_GL003031 [Enterococcus caccae]